MYGAPSHRCHLPYHFSICLITSSRNSQLMQLLGTDSLPGFASPEVTIGCGIVYSTSGSAMPRFMYHRASIMTHIIRCSLQAAVAVKWMVSTSSIRLDPYRCLEGSGPGSEQLSTALHPQCLLYRCAAAVVLCDFLGGMARLLDPTLCACARAKFMVQCPPSQARGMWPTTNSSEGSCVRQHPSLDIIVT